MLAKPYHYHHHILPPKLLPQVKLPPVLQTGSPRPPVQIPRAISIAAPTDQVPAIDNDYGDQVAAFWDYQFLFVSQRSETTDPVPLRVVEGAIPPDFPSGAYYLTGPGMFADDHGSTVHPLDGHGYLRSFTIDGAKGEVRFMAKYIRTEAQLEECDPETGRVRFTHRGPFSVLKGGRRVGNTKVMKNVANTSVLGWGGRLFALWEGGEPYEIESRTLDTVGRFDVMMMDGSDSSPPPAHGVWNVAAKILKPLLYGVFRMAPKRLLSHYKIDAKRNRLLIMSCNAEDMLLPRSNFTFYEYDSKFKLLQRQEFDIPDHLMIHDWAFTDTHYILFGNRIKLDFAGSMGAVCGLSPMISALSVNPSKPTSPIYLLPRWIPGEESNKPLKQRDWRVAVEAPSQLWVLHVGNAFEEMIKRDDDDDDDDDDDEGGNHHLQIQIQASGCSYHWFNFQKMFGYDWQSGKLDPAMMNVQEGEEKLLPHLVQVSIRLDSDGNCQQCEMKPVSKLSRASDFPAINPNYSGTRNKFMYAATSSGSRPSLPHFPFDTVVKMDASTGSIHRWSARTRRFVGEPIFVPRGSDDNGDEDDGYILVVEYAVSTQRCYLIVLDSKRIGKSDALVARIEVPKSLNFPLGFHGFWAPNSSVSDN